MSCGRGGLGMSCGRGDLGMSCGRVDLGMSCGRVDLEMSCFPLVHVGQHYVSQANQKLCCEGVGCDVGGMGRVEMATFI